MHPRLSQVKQVVVWVFTQKNKQSHYECKYEESTIKKTTTAISLNSPAAALVGNLEVWALDDLLDFSGNIFALHVHTQRDSGQKKNKEIVVKRHLVLRESQDMTHRFQINEDILTMS